MLKTLSQTFLSLIFPVSCELCAALLPAGGVQGVCRNCQSAITLIPSPWCAGCGRHASQDGERCGHCKDEKFHFDRAYACVYYDENMKKLLHAFKFERRRFLLPFFTDLMQSFLERSLPQSSWDLVVPVPMDGPHELERGFSQARLLSAALVKKSGIPHAPRALGCKAGVLQSSLRKPQRKRNAERRFFVKNTAGILSSRVLLVDDILTTGQTASACAKALKKAGAKTVTVLALARGI